MWRPKLYWSPENRGISTPTPANAYRIRPEQSKPVMLAPSPTPLLGPCSVPPPQEYGTPICDPPRLITYSMACRPLARGMRLGLVAPGAAAGAGPPPRLIPSPPRNCLPKSSVVWVAWAVACSDALATASGSPGAPALIVAGSVGSHAPGSALASGAGAVTDNTSPVTTAVIQARLIRRKRLWRIAPRSPLDVTDHEGSHAAGAHRRNADLQPDVGCLEHLVVTEVDRHVLAA